ncbi:phosphatidylinositol 5-phosphate 4-kinase type-2 gamma-like isoform X4 [Echeneis naucrates]|uniref:phosphatidylinositol 5-phosphate 4-kinase type-2 gamma-like isoform X4 n=1 Tax=Echeneis naucrates TaxID=173247 RepID=UPI00111417AD|nr:phosphatidylinositol 5-phosphate 4-kinase type-2 gamma-like isoform X4 [Echeneis naucrates]
MSSPSAAGNNLNPKRKTKKKHFVQQKVEVFRASDPVLSVLMWGVNHSINDLSQVPVPVMLLPDNFKASTKIKVNNHLFNKENLPGQFKFKEYCPQVFRNLRERFGIDDQDYQVSLARSPPLKDEEGQSEGLLLTSYDRTLVIKEISSEEVEEMHNILSDYHQHIVTCHGSTLLPQFLAMYRVTVESEDTYLLVMRNMFSHRLHVHSKYDLKFLVHMKMMDYSLLLGIHDVERAEEEEEEEEEEREMASSYEDGGEDENVLALAPSSASSEGIAGYMNSFKPLGPGEFDPYVDVYAVQSALCAPQREVYFMGLIGVLTQYDTKKKAAHAAKAVKHGAGADISTVHPEQYAKRFREFIANIFA